MLAEDKGIDALLLRVIGLGVGQIILLFACEHLGIVGSRIEIMRSSSASSSGVHEP